MKFSKKIYDHSKNPLFNNEEIKTREHQLKLELSVLKAQLYIGFNLVQEEELLYQDVCYQTDLTGDYLGGVDLYISILQRRAVEASDRINAKEFDYYCRSDKAIPAFEYYNNEFYEILGIGEKLYKYLNPSVIEHKILLDKEDDYFSMPFSEQIELIEEALSFELYQNPLYTDLNMEVSEIMDQTIYLENIPLDNDQLKAELQRNLEKYLFGEASFNLVLR